MDKTIKLLMVDDEAEFLDSIAERLEQRDFSVAKASDGEQALAIAERERFDLAVVDLRMPGMDGTALLELLKRQHKKYERDQVRAQKLAQLSFGSSPLGILRAMKELDDDEK